MYDLGSGATTASPSLVPTPQGACSPQQRHMLPTVCMPLLIQPLSKPHQIHPNPPLFSGIPSHNPFRFLCNKSPRTEHPLFQGKTKILIPQDYALRSVSLSRTYSRVFTHLCLFHYTLVLWKGGQNVVVSLHREGMDT